MLCLPSSPLHPDLHPRCPGPQPASNDRGPSQQQHPWVRETGSPLEETETKQVTALQLAGYRSRSHTRYSGGRRKQ